MNPEEYDEFMLELSEEGIITDFQFSDDGTIDRFDIDWPKFFAWNPEIAQTFWEEHCKEVDAMLSNMVDEGLLEAYPVENEDGSLDVGYRLTQLGEVLGEAFMGVEGNGER